MSSIPLLTLEANPETAQRPLDSRNSTDPAADLGDVPDGGENLPQQLQIPEQNTIPRSHGWLPWTLKPRFFIFMLSLEVGIICTLIITLIISERNNGLVTVNTPKSLDISNSFINNVLQAPSSAYSLLWTFVPSSLMSLYGIFW